MLPDLPFLGGRKAGWCGRGSWSHLRGPVSPPRGEPVRRHRDPEGGRGCVQSWRSSTCQPAWPWKGWPVAWLDVGLSGTIVHLATSPSVQPPSVQAFILPSFHPSIDPAVTPSMHLAYILRPSPYTPSICGPAIQPSSPLAIQPSIIHNIPFSSPTHPSHPPIHSSIRPPSIRLSPYVLASISPYVHSHIPMSPITHP